MRVIAPKGPWAVWCPRRKTWRLKADGQEAVTELVTKYRGHLPSMVMNRFKWLTEELHGIGIHGDEQHQIAVGGACYSALRYFPGNGTEFASFAYLPVKNALQRALKTHRGDADRRRLKLSLSGFTEHEGDMDLPDDTEQTEAVRIDVEDAKQRVREALADLTPTERKLMKARFGIDRLKPLTLEATSKMCGLGVTKERVRQVQCLALEKMRRKLTREARCSQ